LKKERGRRENLKEPRERGKMPYEGVRVNAKISADT
jgi:hypothetical protein